METSASVRISMGPSKSNDDAEPQYPSLANYKEPEEAAGLKTERLKILDELKEANATVKALVAHAAELKAKAKNKKLTATDKKAGREHNAKYKVAVAKLNKLNAENEQLLATRSALFKPFVEDFRKAAMLVQERLLLQGGSGLSNRWIGGTFNQEMKSYGPIIVPKSQKAIAAAIQQEVKFQQPYDAVAYFLVMVLRAKLRRGKLELQHNHSLLSKVMHKDCLFDRKTDQGTIQKIKIGTFRVVERCYSTIESFMNGATPENQYDYEGDGEEDLSTTEGLSVTCDFKGSGGAKFKNEEGSEFIVYAYTSGSLPHYPKSRAIKLKFVDNNWKVFEFGEVATPILPPKEVEVIEPKYSKKDLEYSLPQADNREIVHELS